MDTSQLVPANSCEMLVNQWEKVSDLGAYSLFLGVNYPIILPVGGADLARGYLTRSNCVYTSPMSAWQCKMPLPEICRFSLNGEDDVVAFSTGTLAKKYRFCPVRTGEDSALVHPKFPERPRLEQA